jgi:hypothetical protein
VTLFGQAAANAFPSLKNVPPIPETPLSLYEANRVALHKIESEFADAFQAIAAHCAKFKDGRAGWLNGKLFARVNALQYDPVLQSLESNLAEVSRRRAALLDRNAELSKLAGISR